MRVEFSKVVGALCLVLFFGMVSVFASNVFVGEGGISAAYSSAYGNAGATFNLSVVGSDGLNYTLVYENGIVVREPVNGSGDSNESNESEATLSNHATLPNGLISYYSLDETTGSVVDDSHGSNVGINNGASLGEVGIVDYAYNFDSDVTGVLPIATGTTMTWSFWLKGDGYIILSNSLAGSNKGYIDGGVTNDGNWHYIVGTKNGDTFTLYIDGSLKGSDSTTGWNSWAFIEGYPTVNHFFLLKQATGGGSNIIMNQAGSSIIIDEAGIWNRVLTTDEISDLYNSGDGLAYG